MSDRRPVHVLQVAGDPVGGVRRHVHSLLSGLDAREFRISYVYSRSACDRAFRADRERLAPRLAAELALDIRKKPHPSDLGNLLRIVRLIRHEQVDVVHGHGAKGGLYARLAGRLCGIPAVYTPHGGAAHDMFGALESTLYRWVESALVSSTAHYLFESAYTAEAMQRRTGPLARWSINPNGIEPAPLAEPAPLPSAPAGLQVGVFAMLREQKGQRVAIEALRLLMARGQPAVLHLFGDGPDRAALAAQAVAAGLAERVVFHGDVSPVEPWMRALDVVMVPSFFESFSYVAVEAMQQQRLVVAAATGGLREVLGEGAGLLVPPGDAAAMAAALARVAAAPAEAAVIVQRGAERVLTRYSAAAMVAGAAAVYRRLAGAPLPNTGPSAGP